MLKKFEVSNYKNFKEPVQIIFDKIGGYQFNSECITNDNISKMIIYGRNATGKTNLGKALMDISINMSGAHFFPTQKGSYLNADSDEKFATFKYEFQFKDDKVKYIYRKFSEAELLDEELIINDNRIFYYNFETKKYDFDNLGNIEADTVNVERYLQGVDVVNTQSDENQTLPFLRWIINNTALKEDSILLYLEDYIKRMSMIAVGSGGMMRQRIYYEYFYEILRDNSALKDFQEFLNIMGIKCELVLESLPDGQRELYFKHKKLVPFLETASSGTLSLINLYRIILLGRKASMLYMDEFDAFYHYEMSENVIRFFKMKYPECQIVMTTHNTNLMTNRIMRPDCLFILSRKGTLTALCDSTERELREGHNLEKMYISGEFGKYE